jgi:ATP-dependent DNA helicase DinG
MLEASAHHQLKALLRQEGLGRWPHHLTLCRLVGRSLRRCDHTLIRLAAGTDPSWLISLLVPLALANTPIALVVDERLRQRLVQVEWPRLHTVGLDLPCWEGLEQPPPNQLWLLDHGQLLAAWRRGDLGERQLVIPEAELLESRLRQAMAICLEPPDWDRLRRARPAAEPSLLALHERMSRRVLSHPRHPNRLVPVAADEEAPLRQLLALLGPMPAPWSQWLETGTAGWTSWAEVDPALLQWRLHRQPLAPLTELQGLLAGRGAVLVGELPKARGTDSARAPVGAARDGANAATEIGTGGLGFRPQVTVDLGDPPLLDPLPLYCPTGQPLPNSPHYGDHLLEQCRRLVLGQAELTVVLVDDAALRLSLASGLAAEFGSRVSHECPSPESNGVVCASWAWWLSEQARLPHPAQLVVALLPIASLEDPLTAARVESLRRQGGDWFRSLLLPEAINQLQRGVAPLRQRGGGRLAVLDGRLRGRSWGHTALAGLEPWVALKRLLPD